MERDRCERLCVLRGRRSHPAMPSLFQPARDAPAAWNVAKTLAQSAVIWGVTLWLLPLALLRGAHALGIPDATLPGGPLAGWILLGVASGLNVWAGVTMAVRGAGTPLPMDTAQDLVVAGPYRWVRNPMALFGIAQGVGVAVLLSSGLVLAYALSGAVLWHVAVRPLEERDLLARFGAPYAAYRRRVGLWLPQPARDA